MSCPAHVSSLPASIPSVRTSRSGSGTVGNWRLSAREACGCSTERRGSVLPPQQCEPATWNWFVSRWTGAVAVSRSCTSRSASVLNQDQLHPERAAKRTVGPDLCEVALAAWLWPYTSGSLSSCPRLPTKAPLLPQVETTRFHSGSSHGWHPIFRLASRVPLQPAVVARILP